MSRRLAKHKRVLLRKRRAMRAKKRTPPDVSSIFGIGDSGGTDIGQDKDKLIGEAFAALKLNRRRQP